MKTPEGTFISMGEGNLFYFIYDSEEEAVERRSANAIAAYCADNGSFHYYSDKSDRDALFEIQKCFCVSSLFFIFEGV